MANEASLQALAEGSKETLATAPRGCAVPALAPEEQVYPLEVDLGDGNTFADLMGGGLIIVEQVDRETGQHHSVVLTREHLEQLLAAVI